MLYPMILSSMNVLYYSNYYYHYYQIYNSTNEHYDVHVDDVKWTLQTTSTNLFIYATMNKWMLGEKLKKRKERKQIMDNTVRLLCVVVIVYLSAHTYVGFHVHHLVGTFIMNLHHHWILKVYGAGFFYLVPLLIWCLFLPIIILKYRYISDHYTQC